MSRDADLYALVEGLPKNDPAWNLLDAFDAITNGMENPEAMKKAEALRRPELEPWKLLIRAIAALYGGNSEECRRAAAAIPAHSAPGSLKPLFQAWLVRREGASPSGGGRGKARGKGKAPAGGSRPAAELFHRLIIEPHPLALIAEQAEEALRQDLEEQFGGLASRVLCSLKEESPFLGLRYGVYCLTLLNDAGTGGKRFFPLLQKCLGDSDAFCALGFALAGKNNAAAAAALNNALKYAPPPGGGAARGGGEERALLQGNTSGSVQVLARFLESASPAAGGRGSVREAGGGAGKRGGGRGRRGSSRLQPDLFAESPPPPGETGAGQNAGLTTGKLLGLLKKSLSGEALSFIERALRVPPSFEELIRELPPAVRYLGPGMWIRAIKDSRPV
ncbi:MAG: hypothetical protein LBG84_07845 [Treponema sp.]|jgi:hypothetical protein|nr:hypothetical protein [Treponema sp.]